MKYLSYPAFLLLAFLSGFSLSSAQADPEPEVSFYENPIKYGGGDVVDVPSFLYAAVDLIYLIAVPIIVICIIYSGFLFVTAGDNEAQIGKARTVFIWTVIGAGVLLGAKALSLAIQATIDAL